jgi:hypothetical protein
MIYGADGEVLRAIGDIHASLDDKPTWIPRVNLQDLAEKRAIQKLPGTQRICIQLWTCPQPGSRLQDF